MTTIIVVISIILQLTAAVWAIRLNRLTGRRTAWILISIALVLMAVRRIIALSILLLKAPTPATDLNEIVGLAISVLMFLGVLLIEGYFRHNQEAEREVREREHLFHRLFEKGGEANLLIDNGVFIDCNDRAVEMLGLTTPAQLLGREPGSISPPQQPDGVASDCKARAMIERGLTDGSVRFEWMHTRADGSELPVDVILTAIPFHGRTILHTAWRDISARRRAEQALRESLQTSEDIIRSMPSGIFIYQYDAATDRFLVIGGNSEAERLTGTHLTELRGRGMEELWRTWYSRPGVRERVMDVIRNGSPYHDESVEYDDGHFKGTFRLSVFRLPGFRVVMTFEDITVQRQREEAIRLSEERHRTLVETMAQGVVYQGADGHILSTNPAGERILGLSFDQMIGRTSMDPRWRTVREDGSDFPGDAHPAMEALRTGQPVNGAMMGVYNPATDTCRWIIVNAVPLFRPGELSPYQVYATFTDITALKLAEEENRILNAQLEDRVKARTSELEYANQELEAFTYSISHDLQAPVRAIEGFSRALAERCAAQLSPDGQRYLEFLQESAGKMQDLIQALLKLSRTGRTPINTATVDPAVLVRDVLATLQSELEGRVVDIQVDPLPHMIADPTLMKQVFHNLLSNAIKFTARCQRAEIHVGCKVAGPSRVYFVRDNGVGFDPEHAERLFGVFQRLHREEDFKGTGVGLAIVQRIIRRHSGWIWAEARPGGGATFYFHLHGQPKTAEVPA
jgi:PAS domain S-box-containing protein